MDKAKIKEIFEEIMKYQMDNVQIARSTMPYRLAQKGIDILEGKNDKQSNCEHKKVYYCLSTGGMRCRQCQKLL